MIWVTGYHVKQFAKYRHNFKTKQFRGHNLKPYQQVRITTISKPCWKISRGSTRYKHQLTVTELCSLLATPGWMFLSIMHGLLRTMTLLCWEIHVFDCDYDRNKCNSAHRRYTNRAWHKSEVADYNYIINTNATPVLARQYRTFTVQWWWENVETSPSRPQRFVGLVIVKVCRIPRT